MNTHSLRQLLQGNAPRYALATIFYVAAAAKLTVYEQVVDMFGRWGLGAKFMVFVAILEIAGATMVLLPRRRVRFLGAMLLAWIMLGAIAMHLSSQELLLALIPIAVLALASWVAWRSFPRGQDHASWETAQAPLIRGVRVPKVPGPAKKTPESDRPSRRRVPVVSP